MTIQPAAPEWNLSLTEAELRVARDALSKYVQEGNHSQDEMDAAWSVLVEITRTIGRETT